MELKLQDWITKNIPEDKMLWEDSMEKQVFFIRDTLSQAFPIKTREEFNQFKDSLMVISEHTSKSINLPVYQVSWKEMVCILRNNFYDWKVSVRSTKKISVDLSSYEFKTGKKVTHSCCEGFKAEWVYDSYENNKEQFTIEISNDYQLFCFFKLLSCN